MRKRQPLIRASSGADDIYERFYLNCCNVYELWVPGTVLRRFDLRHGSVTLPSLVCTAWCFISGRNDPVRHDRNESHHYVRDAMLYLLIRSGSDCDRWSCREASSGQRDIDISHLRRRSLRTSLASILLFANFLAVKDIYSFYHTRYDSSYNY